VQLVQVVQGPLRIYVRPVETIFITVRLYSF